MGLLTIIVQLISFVPVIKAQLKQCNESHCWLADVESQYILPGLEAM